jgi:hypothetical protein
LAWVANVVMDPAATSFPRFASKSTTCDCMEASSAALIGHQYRVAYAKPGYS